MGPLLQKQAFHFEGLMFNINLLSSPGVQSDIENTHSVTFIKEKVELKQTPELNIKHHRSINTESRSLYLFIVGILLVLVLIFYNYKTGVISELSNKLIKSEITQDEIMDLMINIIIESKSNYIIHEMSFTDGELNMILNAKDHQKLEKVVQLCSIHNESNIKIIGNGNEYSIISSLPWNLNTNKLQNISEDLFLQKIKPAKGVRVKVNQNYIEVIGKPKDIVSVILQMANTGILYNLEMNITSFQKDSLLFKLKL